MNCSSKSIALSNNPNISEMSTFSSASNITTESTSRKFSNGSLIFGIDGSFQKNITSNDTSLTIAIADINISEGFSFYLAHKPRFKKVMELARDFYNTYIPPNINIISKVLLDVINEQKMKINLAMIENEEEIFGLLFLGDGATI